jgi:hypothetical protein
MQYITKVNTISNTNAARDPGKGFINGNLKIATTNFRGNNLRTEEALSTALKL